MAVDRFQRQFRNSLKTICFLGLLVFYSSCENSYQKRETLLISVIDIKELNMFVNEADLLGLLETSRNQFLQGYGDKGVLVLYHDSISNENLRASFHINLSEMYYCPPSYSSIYQNIPIAIYSRSELAIKDSMDIRRLYANYMNDDMIGYRVENKIDEPA